ncbi:MAG: hypothetical protein ACD_43C00096G0005 [uncultured bacterium]|nr:MAG: hypothetical protein ACD_43C00096G0005 [uncultured bacterium]
MKPKLAFVDHSFHKNTHSGDFLRELFSTQFEVIDFWDECWRTGKTNLSINDINNGNFTHVFFFQSIFPIAQLNQLKPTIIWAPMYDSVLSNDSIPYLMKLAQLPIKVLCFSKALYTKFTTYGFECIYTQYFFNPATQTQIQDYSNLRIFLWQRTNINFSYIKKLFYLLPIKQCIIKCNPDPGYRALLPSKQDRIKYNITVIEKGFTEKTQYLNLLQQSNIFVCPRHYEGIGMSFLEALSIGLIPAAIDAPTMNEYIIHGKNGLLFNNHTKKLDLSTDALPNLGKCVKEFALNGYNHWLKQKMEILRFIQSPFQPKKHLTKKMSRQIFLISLLPQCWKNINSKFFD